MANRRMFSLKVIDTDLFLDMPASTQLLYFHLSLRADDDGFVASPKKIQKIVGCGDDDFKLLIAKQFIIPFDTGICVIRHWRIHNYIQNDRYNPTLYQCEKNMLETNNGAYEINVDTECIQDVSNLDTQVRLGKVSLEIEKEIDNTRISWRDILTTWNDLPSPIKPIRAITDRRKDKIKARINSLKLKQEDIIQAIKNIKLSSFLQGKNSKRWIVDFDWLFMDDTRFSRVFEGKYQDKGDEKRLGSNKSDSGKSEENTEDEGERLARRAHELYGDVGDTECDF